MEEPGRLQSTESWRVRHDWATSLSLSCIGEGNGNPLQFLTCRIPETGEPGGLPSMGSHKVGHDWSDLAAAAPYLSSDADINKPSRKSHLIFMCPFLRVRKCPQQTSPHLIIARIVSQTLITCQPKIRSITRSPPLTELDLGLASLKDWVIWKRSDSFQGKKQKITDSN